MKKYLLVLFFITAFTPIKSQVVFCPPGAEWRYEFTKQIFDFYGRHNEKIFYHSDSVVGQDTFKVLAHNKFFKQCNYPSYAPTLIKQKGDTIFFKNSRTQNNWEILYNFACSVGQGWQTTIIRKDATPITYSYIVDSSYYITINNISLKRIRLQGPFSVLGWITERFGSSQFLFNYDNSGIGFCDGDYFVSFLCYSDNIFGTTQFSYKSCDYHVNTGIEVNESNLVLEIFPNPVNNFLNLKTDLAGEMDVSFTDIYGREVKRIQIENNKKVDVSDLSKGIYLLIVSRNKEILSKTRLIKE